MQDEQRYRAGRAPSDFPGGIVSRGVCIKEPLSGKYEPQSIKTKLICRGTLIQSLLSLVQSGHGQSMGGFSVDTRNHTNSGGNRRRQRRERMKTGFLFYLGVLLVFASLITVCSAAAPDPYFDSTSSAIDHCHVSGSCYAFDMGRNVTNGGGSGNVFFTINGTHHYPLNSTVFWMDAGEHVRVWTNYTGARPLNEQWTYTVRAALPGDPTVGYFVIERFGSPATPPSVTAISPSLGPIAGGTRVTLTGTGFTGATVVRFGTTTGTGMTVNSSTRITVTAPAHASGTVYVTVTTPGGTSATVQASRYRYLLPPGVTALSPSRGPIAGGNRVTLTGTGFTGVTAVRFSWTAGTGIIVNSTTSSLTVTAPNRFSGTVYVTVTTPGGTSATVQASRYTYILPPGVTSVSPAGGPAAGGTRVTLTGTGFTGATAVRFGTTAGTGITVNSASSLAVTAPAHAAGTVHVTVTTPGGTSAPVSTDRFTYTA
jgi:hypothetical protein